MTSSVAIDQDATLHALILHLREALTTKYGKYMIDLQPEPTLEYLPCSENDRQVEDVNVSFHLLEHPQRIVLHSRIAKGETMVTVAMLRETPPPRWANLMQAAFIEFCQNVNE